MREYELNPDYSIDIGLLKHKVEALTIAAEAELVHGSEVLGEIDNLLASVTGRRDTIIQGYEEAIAGVRAEYQPYIRQLQDLKGQVKDKMLEYKRMAKERIKQIQDDIASGRIERTEIFVDENGKIINETALSIRTGEGLSSVRKYYVVAVTDFAKVPDELKKFDKKAALAMAKKGIKNIPGLAIEEREAIQYRNKFVA